MGWWAGLKTAIAVGRAAYDFKRELEAQGAARLSPENAKRDRRRVQRLIVWLHEGENKGLRGITTLDDGIDVYLGAFLQSSLVEIYLNPVESKESRAKARAAIMAGAEGQEEPRVYPVH